MQVVVKININKDGRGGLGSCRPKKWNGQTLSFVEETNDWNYSKVE
jgi:hypothetical protein